MAKGKAELLLRRRLRHHRRGNRERRVPNKKRRTKTNNSETIRKDKHLGESTTKSGVERRIIGKKWPKKRKKRRHWSEKQRKRERDGPISIITKTRQIFRDAPYKSKVIIDFDSDGRHC